MIIQNQLNKTESTKNEKCQMKIRVNHLNSLVEAEAEAKEVVTWKSMDVVTTAEEEVLIIKNHKLKRNMLQTCDSAKFDFKFACFVKQNVSNYCY